MRQRFDVTGNLEKFGILEGKQGLTRRSSDLLTVVEPWTRPFQDSKRAVEAECKERKSSPGTDMANQVQLQMKLPGGSRAAPRKRTGQQS